MTAERDSTVHDAVRYPLRGEDAIGTLLIGGLLVSLWLGAATTAALATAADPRSGAVVALPTLPVVGGSWLLLLGFLVACLRRSANGRDEPPRFDSWGQLLLDGLRGTVVVAAFALPILVVFAITAAAPTVAPTVPASALGPLEPVSSWVPVVQPWVPFVGAGLFAAGVSYPAAVVLCAMSIGGLRAMGSVQSIAAGGTVEFTVAWLGSLVATVLVIVVATPLLVLFVGAVAMFYVPMAASRLLGRAYRSGLAAPPG